ncbi:RtcB family protein, partial [Coxiella burnetii]|uniref:RtcB family protein n=1 Tax=Coxiella burnetii TaxID=777 RepID=UPI0022A87A31
MGFDISCGIRCLRTNLVWDEFKGFREAVADELYHRIPAGVGVGGFIKLTPSQLDEVLVDGAGWAIKRG